MTLDDLDVSAGEMRQRVSLVQLTETRDPKGYAQNLKSYTTVATYWASVRPSSGRGLVNAGQTKNEVTHAVVMRWNPDVATDPTYRLVYNGRILNIEVILNIKEQSKKAVLLCSEQVVPRTS